MSKYLYIVLIFLLSGCSEINLGIPKEEVLEKQVLKLETVLTNRGIKRIGNQLLFRPDSKELISTVKDRTNSSLYVWDLENKELKHTINKREKRIRRSVYFLFSEDSKKLLFSTQLNTKPQFNYGTRKRIYRHINHFGEIPTDNYDEVKFHKYNEFETYENEYIKTKFGTGKFKKKVKTTARAVGIFMFKDNYLVTNSYFNEKGSGLVYFDKNTFKVKHVEKDTIEIWELAISQNKDYLATSKINSIRNKDFNFKLSLEIYDLNSLKLITNIPNVYSDISIKNLIFLDNNHIAVGPAGFSETGYRAKDGNFYIKNIRDIPIKVINIKTKKEDIYFQKGYGGVSLLPIDENYFISYSSSKSVLIVWNRKTKKPVQKLKFGKYSFGMAISSDKKQIALSSDDKIYIYRVNNKGNFK